MAYRTRALVTSVCALALAACGGGKSLAVVVAPSELPYLGKTTTGEIDVLPVVTAIDGSSYALSGPVESVELTVKRRVVPVAVPFTSRIAAEQIEVSTDQVRTYPIADISQVLVRFTDSGEQRRNNWQGSRVNPHNKKKSSSLQIVGIALAAGSILPFGLGTALIVEDQNCVPGFLDFCGVGTAIGGAMLISGGAMLITGLVLAASGSSSGNTHSMKIHPTLRLSPTGGSLSLEF